MSHNAYNAETDDAPYTDLFDAVEADPDRYSEEKEVGISFSNPDDRMRVDAAIPAVMRRLLKHPEFDLRLYTTTEDGVAVDVTAEEYTAEGHDGRKPVYWVSGTLPVGVLTMKQSPRKSGGHANVVSSGVLND